MLVDMGGPSFGWRLPYAHRIRHRDGHRRRDVVLDPLEQQPGLVAAIRDLRRIGWVSSFAGFLRIAPPTFRPSLDFRAAPRAAVAAIGPRSRRD